MTLDRPPTLWQRRRGIGRILLRVLAPTTVVIALYYAVPLDRLDGTPTAIPLALGLLGLLAVGAWQIQSVVDAERPQIRAVEAFALHVPLLMVLFACGYYLLARADPGAFNVHLLTRTDSLYFTVTVFSTVGFGDIAATSQAARVVVMVQIVLNLTVLGLGVRLLTRAVQVGSTRRSSEQHPENHDPAAASPD